MARRSQRGLTLLEIMVVIAILGIGIAVMSSGLVLPTGNDLADDATELSAVMRRASQLALETGEQHRVVFDLDTQNYIVEECKGTASLARGKEVVRNDEEKAKQALEKGQERLRDLPEDTLAVGDPESAVKRATAIAGHHIADRTCSPVTGGVTLVEKANKRPGSSKPDEWLRQLDIKRGNKFKEIWVQHKDDSTTKGQIAIYFYPNGSSEKAVIELTDGNSVRSVLVYGLTGYIQEKSGKLDDVDEHMLRNAMGGRDKKREVE
jgi:general secretion pathway protein H